MNNLKLYEEYINSASNRISTLLKNLVQSLNASFSGTNSSLGQKDLEGLALIDIEQSNSNDAFEKNVLMRFSDHSYQYQMIFVLKLDDVKGEDPINKGYMKLKIYDGNQANLLREWQNNLTIAVGTDEEMNTEGRWFLKVGENDAQSQGQSQEEGQEEEGQEEVQTSNLDFIESFILEKLGFLKDMLDKQTGAQDGPQLQQEEE